MASAGLTAARMSAREVVDASRGAVAPVGFPLPPTLGGVGPEPAAARTPVFFSMASSARGSAARLAAGFGASAARALTGDCVAAGMDGTFCGVDALGPGPPPLCVLASRVASAPFPNMASIEVVPGPAAAAGVGAGGGPAMAAVVIKPAPGGPGCGCRGTIAIA